MRTVSVRACKCARLRSQPRTRAQTNAPQQITSNRRQTVVRLDASTSVRQSSVVYILRHIIALAILFTSLLAAGVPAYACGEMASLSDCCPNGPGTPCKDSHRDTTQTSRPDVCCAAGIAAATTAVGLPSIEFSKHCDHNDLATLCIVLTELTSAYVDSPRVDTTHDVTRPLSDSTLYLSTGRLRL